MEEDSPIFSNPSSVTPWSNTLVAVFPNAFGKEPTNRRLGDLLHDIRTGKYKTQVAEIRATYHRVLRKTSDPDEAKEAIKPIKKLLPTFCISGTAANRKKPLSHSGLIQIDVDGLCETLPTVRERLKADRHCAFGFVSPSGTGLKIGLRIDGTRHKESFDAAQRYFQEQYGLRIDPACKDRLRLCFVSHDPEMWTNPNPIALHVPAELEQVLAPKKRDTKDIRLHSESCITASLNGCISTSLHNSSESVLENIQSRKKALESLAAKHPGLVKLYTELIEPRYQAQREARNRFIVEAVPFLYRAVSPQFVLELVGCFYDCNRGLFKDSREQHMNEAKAMLESVAQTYILSLTPGERGIYDALNGHEKDAFRICRDLALLASPNKSQGAFYMSFNQLGDRLGVFPMQAQRIMRQLESYGIVKLTKKGTRRAPGIAGEAGEYVWCITS